MKVVLIEQYASSFSEAIKLGKFEPDIHLNDVATNWEKHWDIESSALAATFETSLSSKISYALWEGSRNSPKYMMTMMITENKEFMRSTFKDLFNDEKDLALRLHRFRDHCDEIFFQIREKSKLYNTHFHDNKKYPLMYLTCYYPDKYCFWDYSSFEKMMQKLGAMNIPDEVETERYYKSMRAIFGIIQKDTTRITNYQDHLRKSGVNNALNLIFMNHFAQFVALNS